jgi:CheY-like chemotaxis protein
MGLLTGGIAHDINNLLGLIDLRLELAKKGIAELSPQMMQISKASEAVQRGAKLVRRLLVFSRSEPLSSELYDLNDVIGNLASLLRKTVGIDTTIAFFPASAPLMCSVDGAELEAAVVNLIVNARDALGGKGVVRVTLNQMLIDGTESLDSLGAVVQPGRYARIAVSDDGCGMSSETLSRCFDPFFTTKKLNNGTGLGLSTMVGFVHQVGGAIYIDSEVHEGTEVRLLLPLSPKVAGLTAGSKALGTASEPLRTETLQKTILIVEDDDDLRDALTSLLRHRGFNVEEALSALTAEDKLKECPDIVLVLSDVMMPGGMNGVELLQKVQNKSPHIKCLLMTGYADNAFANLSAAHYPIEIVRKPFDFEDLASRIDKLLTDHEL